MFVLYNITLSNEVSHKFRNKFMKTKTKKKNVNPTNKNKQTQTQTQPKTKTKTKNQRGGKIYILRNKNIKLIHNLIYKNHNIKSDTDNKVYVTIKTNPSNHEKSLQKEIPMSLSQWYIDPDRIGDFTSAIHGSLTPMDCAISAMQMIGFITGHESNLLRMTGIHGIHMNNIIKLFTYISIHQKNKPQIENNIIMANNNNKVVFEQFRLYDLVFYTDKSKLIKIVKTLKDSRICFVGHLDETESKSTSGHAYCFFNNQGDIYLIDPQNKDYELTLCNNNDECEKIMTRGLDSDTGIKRYYFALFRSDPSFSDTDVETITNAMGFDLYRHGRRMY
jgi:hypothetical protein